MGSVRAVVLPLANVTLPLDTVSAWIASILLTVKKTVYVSLILNVAVSLLPGVLLSAQLAPKLQLLFGGTRPLPSQTSGAARASGGDVATVTRAANQSAARRDIGPPSVQGKVWHPRECPSEYPARARITRNSWEGGR